MKSSLASRANLSAGVPLPSRQDLNYSTKSYEPNQSE
jgi:hypothetical protein